MLNLYTIGATNMIVPSDKRAIGVATVPSSLNTNEVAHPYVSTVSAWTGSSLDVQPVDACAFDDTRSACNGVPEGYCDFSVTFPNLDALQAAASQYPDYCLNMYASQVIADMMAAALSNYTSVDDGYDKLFGYYVKYIQQEVPAQLAAFMSDEDGPGNKYFDCTYQNNRGVNTTTHTCPFDQGTLSNDFYTIYYTPKNGNTTGFFNELLSTYGIDPSWVQFGTKTYASGVCPPHNGVPCERYKQVFKGFPLAADSYTVPNPKDIITAALPHISNITNSITSTQWDVYMGQWGGSQDDIVQVQATVAFMIIQAIENMQQVKDIGEDEEEAERKALIIEIISIVLIFVPFVGEAVATVEGLADIARIIALIGAAGNTGLGILDIVNDPSSAPSEILGILLGAEDFRTPKGFSRMGRARRAMGPDDVAKVGTLFKSNSDKLDGIIKACKSV